MKIIANFFCGGVARPKGSMRSFGKGRMVNSNPKTKPWQESVSKAASEANNTVYASEAPVEITLCVFVGRPKSHFTKSGRLKGSAPEYPTSRVFGDLDKHARLVGDALTGIVYRDDSQIVDMNCSKRFTQTGYASGVSVIVALSDLHDTSTPETRTI